MTRLAVAVVGVLMVAGLHGAGAAEVKGHVEQVADSTHWTGWYGVYTPCKNDAQMHWRYYYPGYNEFSRHYCAVA